MFVFMLKRFCTSLKKPKSIPQLLLTTKYSTDFFWLHTKSFSSSAMSKSALMILAQGAEEMETVITVDMLRRGGVTVTLAGLDSNSPVLCSRQVTLVPDKSLADALAEKSQYDAVTPTAFVAHGVAQGKRITSYPSTKDKITSDYTYIEGERVVVDGNIVTSRGPGTAYWFGLTLIEMLTGKEKAQQVEKGMLISGY